MSASVQYLRPAEFAASSGISLATVNRLIAAGEIDSVKVRKSRLIPVNALEKLRSRSTSWATKLDELVAEATSDDLAELAEHLDHLIAEHGSSRVRTGRINDARRVLTHRPGGAA